MARVPGLIKAEESTGLWHRMWGKSLAGGWSRAAAQPAGSTGRSRAGYYAAALTAGSLKGDDAARVARSLLWCDAEAGQYVPDRIPYYRAAWEAFPNDECCSFFVATLCRQGVIEDRAVHLAAKARHLRITAPFDRALETLRDRI